VRGDLENQTKLLTFVRFTDTDNLSPRSCEIVTEFGDSYDKRVEHLDDIYQSCDSINLSTDLEDRADDVGCSNFSLLQSSCQTLPALEVTGHAPPDVILDPTAENVIALRDGQPFRKGVETALGHQREDLDDIATYSAATNDDSVASGIPLSERNLNEMRVLRDTADALDTFTRTVDNLATTHNYSQDDGVLLALEHLSGTTELITQISQ